jgi:hypothetical protein
MPADRPPPDIPAKLASSLLLLGELHRIDAALRAAHIDFIVLKGLPLALRLTGRIDGRFRPIRDNDILVKHADLPRAVEVFEQLGYAAVANLTLESQLVVNFELEMERKLPHGGSVVAEIHWAPFPPLLYPVDEDYLWSRTEIVDVSGRSMRVLDRTLTLLQLASHFIQHGGAAPWVLHDLAMAWNAWGAEIGAAELGAAAERTGLEHALAFALAAASDRQLLTRAAPGVSGRVRALRKILPTTRLDQVQARRTLELLLLAPPRRIPRWFWLRLVPPPANIAARYGQPMSRKVYLLYPLRPVLALAQLVGSKLRRGSRSSTRTSA